MRILAIGDKDMVIGFKLAGVSLVFEVKNAEEAKSILRDAFHRQDVGIILIAQWLAEELRAFIDKLIGEAELPIIVEVPGREGIKEGVDPIKELIRKAVGIEIKI